MRQNMLSRIHLLVAVLLSAAYAVGMYLLGERALFLLGAPVVVGIIGYQITPGAPVTRRLISSLAPLIGFALLHALDLATLPWAYPVLHAIAIGMVITQLWELVLWLAGREKGDSNVQRRDA